MLEHRSLLLDIDPRSPEGHEALASRPDDVPDTIPSWEALLAATMEEAERLGYDTTEVSVVDQRRMDGADMHLLASLNPPQYYQPADQAVIQRFFSALLQATLEKAGDEFVTRLRDALKLINYAVDNELLVRIGRPGEIELERADMLAPVGRRGEPAAPAVLARWTQPGKPEFAAAECCIDELFQVAEQLGMDATQAAFTEAEIRRQPAPARLRLDEDITELLALAEAVISRSGDAECPVSQRFVERLNQLAALLRFVSTENLLLASRR